ncbi:ficolin-1-like [Clytia hemisphaerica]|uniref:Fibrinogen C-terminal domain-containing protein n=1 Tax=Clytia hemisphaerica TaxID=252671 RepID=A0A7M5X4V9_9CNID
MILFILQFTFVLQIKCITASTLLSAYQSKAIDDHIQPLTTLQVSSQAQCLHKYRSINTEAWLVEIKQWGTGNWSCRLFSYDEYARIRKWMVDDGNSNVYVNLTKEYQNEVEINRQEELEREKQLYDNDVSCWTLKRDGQTSDGVYQITIGGRPVNVYCDMVENGGGWTLIQRRVEGSTNFYRGWEDYKNGFGQPTESYWIGLDQIHELTTKYEGTIYIRMRGVYYQGSSFYLTQRDFQVGDESTNYQVIEAGTYAAGDRTQGFSNLEGLSFSTNDKDNDEVTNQNCASTFSTAWWFADGCLHVVNPNGKFGDSSVSGILWLSTPMNTFSMAIKRVIP